MISISKEVGVSEKTVSIVIKYFFLGIRRIMYKNGDINVFGLFKIKMKKAYRKKVDLNPNIKFQKNKPKKTK